MHFYKIMYNDSLGIIIGTDDNGLNKGEDSRNGETRRDWRNIQKTGLIEPHDQVLSGKNI